MLIHVVLGASGPVGIGVSRLLRSQGKDVRTVSRRAKIEGLEGLGLPHTAADATDAEQCMKACEGAAFIYNCVGVEYKGAVWQKVLPQVAQNAINAAAVNDAVLIQAGDLYGYDPHALHFATAVTPDLQRISQDKASQFPKCCAMARVIDLHEQNWKCGHCTSAVVLASDLYGPGIRSSQLGEAFFEPLTKGGGAKMLVNPNTMHSYTYVDDFCRAMVCAGENRRARNRILHAPTSEGVTATEIVGMAVGSHGRLDALPGWLGAMLSPFIPIVKEIREVRHQFEKDWIVQSQFPEEFPEFGEPMAINSGVMKTIKWYSNPEA